jgi:hypothetical protein
MWQLNTSQTYAGKKNIFGRDRGGELFPESENVLAGSKANVSEDVLHIPVEIWTPDRLTMDCCQRKSILSEIDCIFA